MFGIKVLEKIKIPILCPLTFFKKIMPIYEIIWDNIAEPGRSQMTL